MLNELPTDVLGLIFNKIDLKTLYALSGTNKNLFSIAINKLRTLEIRDDFTSFIKTSNKLCCPDFDNNLLRKLFHKINHNYDVRYSNYILLYKYHFSKLIKNILLTYIDDVNMSDIVFRSEQLDFDKMICKRIICDSWRVISEVKFDPIIIYDYYGRKKREDYNPANSISYSAIVIKRDIPIPFMIKHKGIFTTSADNQRCVGTLSAMLCNNKIIDKYIFEDGYKIHFADNETPKYDSYVYVTVSGSDISCQIYKPSKNFISEIFTFSIWYYH